MLKMLATRSDDAIFLTNFIFARHEGGITVTAAALQELNTENGLWLAVNERISSGIKWFMDWVLDQLRGATTRTKRSVKNVIFDEAVRRAQRIAFYPSKLVLFDRKCRKTLKLQNKVRSLC